MPSDKKNSLWLSFQYSVSLILALVTLKLNLKTFGNAVFDIWLLLASVWSIGSIVDLGFGTAVVKHIAEALHENKSERINTIVSTSFFIFTFLGLVLFLAGNVIASLVYYGNPKLIPASFLNEAKAVFIFLGFNFYMFYLFTFFRAVFEGSNNFVIPSIINLVYNVIIFVSVVVVYFMGLKLFWLSVLYAACALVVLLLSYYFMKTRLRDIQIHIKYFNQKTFRQLFTFSLSVQLMSLIGAFLDPVIKYIIGNFAPSGYVSIYELARRFSIAISGLFSTAFKNILPKVSVLKTRNDYREYLKTSGVKFSKLGIVYSGFTFGVCALLFVFILDRFYGYRESVIFFFILSLAESVNNTFFNLYVFVVGIGKSFFLILIQLFNLSFIAIGMILGFYLFNNSFGMLAYFFSVTIGNLLTLVFIKKQAEFSIISFFKEVKIYKLMLFHLLIVSYLIIMTRYPNGLLWTGGLFSLLSFLLFFNDIGQILLFLKNNFLKKAEV